jgi:hypothetical protein
MTLYRLTCEKLESVSSTTFAAEKLRSVKTWRS